MHPIEPDHSRQTLSRPKPNLNSYGRSDLIKNAAGYHITHVTLSMYRHKRPSLDLRNLLYVWYSRTRMRLAETTVTSPRLNRAVSQLMPLYYLLNHYADIRSRERVFDASYVAQVITRGSSDSRRLSLA